MSHKYEVYLKEYSPKEKLQKEKPKKIFKKDEQIIQKNEKVQNPISKGKMALNRLKNMSDLVIYTEILGKPKGFEY